MKKVSGTFVVILCLCWVLFFHHLAERDLWSSHEGRAAQNAQTILDTGSWGLPALFDGHIELQKPPVYYWLVAVLGQMNGGRVDAWAVRLPSALAALGCVLGLYVFGLRLGRPAMGAVAAIILASAQHFTWLARIGRIDMPLTLAVGAALGFYYLGRRRGQHDSGPRRPHALREAPHAEREVYGCQGAWWSFLAAYIAVAVAVLLKGPIGAVLPLSVVGLHLLVEGDLPLRQSTDVSRAKRSLHLLHQLGLWWGIPLVLALVLPWFWWANLQTDGELVRSFFWYHHVQRVMGGSLNMHAKPWWFYLPRLAADLLPWSVLLPVAVYWMARHAWRLDAAARFGCAWLLAIFAVLSCVGFKRADYLLPAYPGAALLLGCLVDASLNGKTGSGPLRKRSRPRFPVRWKPRLIVAFGTATLGCVAGWWVYVDRILPRSESVREHRQFAAEIRKKVPAPQPVLFFWTEAHTLVFHVGNPIRTFIEWEELDALAGSGETHYIVMPPRCAESWREHLTSGTLEPMIGNSDLTGGPHEQPLVLMRTVPPTPIPARRASEGQTSCPSCPSLARRASLR